MTTNLLRPWANALSVGTALTINILAATLPLNGQDTGAISDRFQVFFVPAGYVFAIWGVIYLGWIAFSVFQFLPAQQANPRLQRLGYWFALSGLFNAAWLFCWHYNEFGLSVWVMLALLGTLIISYLRLDVGRVPVTATERWCVDIPFSVYLGWVSVATVANITDWLYWVNWDGWGLDPQMWAVIMLAVASTLGVLMALTRRDAGYLGVFVWAFVGIAVKHAGVMLVAGAALTAAVLALALAVFTVIQRRRPLAAR